MKNGSEVNIMIKLIILVTILISGMTKSSYSQQVEPGKKVTGEIFPELKTKNLSGDMVRLPDALNGKVTLILVAFERGAQEILDSWLVPFSEKFKSNEKIGFFEIPMLKGRWRLMAKFIDRGMRGGIPADKHKYIITYYGNINKYREKLSMEDTSTGYVFLTDKDGKIRWANNGPADKFKLDNLFYTVELLSKEYNFDAKE